MTKRSHVPTTYLRGLPAGSSGSVTLIVPVTSSSASTRKSVGSWNEDSQPLCRALSDTASAGPVSLMRLCPADTMMSEPCGSLKWP